MKQLFRYITVVAMMLVGTMASAQSTSTVKVMDGITNGTVTVDKSSAAKGETVTITVTPSDGYYFEKNNLEVAKTFNLQASTRGSNPIIPVGGITISGNDPADLSTKRTYTFVVPDVGYEFQISATFTARKTITDEMVKLSSAAFVYNAKEQKPTVSIDGLTKDTDYTLDFAGTEWKESGSYSLTVNGKNKYKGTVTKTITISKADGTIKFAENTVTKSFGDESFTNTLTNNGDGEVTYASSNPSVATVDTKSGGVTIAGIGKATITATVIDGKNYQYATKSIDYAVQVASGDIIITAKGLEVTYDGNPHSISVFVTSPDDATVKYGKTSGIYDLTTNPTYTKAGTYTVYYQITREKYNTVTGSQTVVINKAHGSISFATSSLSKTYEDEPFTNELNNTGDGTVIYASSNTAVATVDANGKVTIVGHGETTITATVTDGENYEYATKTASYKLGVGSAVMEVTATGYEGTYDGKAYGITVEAPEGATVKYGVESGTYDKTESPTFSEAGVHRVYYEVTKPNFTAVTGSQTVTINKAAGSISYAITTVNKKVGDEAFTNELTNTGDGTITFTSSDTSVATVDATGKVTIVSNGESTIVAHVVDGTNFKYSSKTTSYAILIEAGDLQVTANGYEGTYDGKPHGITVTASEGATVKYGVKSGNYNLTESPTYTDASTNTVYYQVTKDHFNTITGSQTVTINKAIGSMYFAASKFSKTFGDTSFTNRFTNTGDGTVTFASSNTAVATVNAISGEVTIIGNGETTITATVTDAKNYTYASNTVSYTIEVGPAAMNVTANGYRGIYDKKYHGITVTAPEDAIVMYGESEGTYNMTESPTYSDAGDYTIYYQVTKTNFKTVTGSQTVTISKAAASISFDAASVSKKTNDAPFINPIINSGDGIVAYSSDNTEVATVDAATGEVTILKEGIAIIYATVADGKNYTYATKTVNYTIGVGYATLNVTAKGYEGIYDGQAHGITVTAPEGATIMYGETAGTYDKSDCPEYTDAGTYTVYYQVTKDNYATVQNSETVTIKQAAGTISYETSSISKKYGDAAFTNTLTNSGDGTVTYSSSHEDVATVDANGKVTITGNGTTTIAAIVTDGKNYTYATKSVSYTLSVGTTAMEVSAKGFEGTYDGKAHGITVSAPEGAEIGYGVEKGTYNLTQSPTYTEAGTYTVYYQVTKPNFTTVTGSQTVTISKAAASISFDAASVSKKATDPAFINTITNSGDGIVAYSSDNTEVATVDATTGEVTILKEGTAKIYATITSSKNYSYVTKKVSYTIGIGNATLNVTAKGYEGIYDGQAHSITVTVTAPEDATIMYGETAGTYDKSECPEYTDAGTYTVYYQVSKENYTTVENSETVTIKQAAGTISFETASISKKYGDAAFTNTLTISGDGTVTYSSSHEDVATVDADGKVTIIGNGTATITAIVTDGKNYTYTTKSVSYSLSVGTAAMEVSAKGFEGTYDGKAHGITVTIPEGAAIGYGVEKGIYNLTESPTYTETGTYTVYYKVTKDKYTPVENSATITISQAAATISYAAASISKKYGDPKFTNELDNTGDGVVSYASDKVEVATIDASTGEVTIVGNGTATITATVADGKNYTYATKSASYTLSVGTAAMEVSATGYEGTYDGKNHSITVKIPEEATIMYGKTEGAYDLTENPTYTESGTYTVYYRVTKTNYTPVTGSQTVIINKAIATISFDAASVSKKTTDPAFINTITNSGDGIVTYSSDNTEVATVDATTGEVTILKEGTAKITAIVADGKNYTYATKTVSYTIGIGNATLNVTAKGYEGIYDGQAHGITVTALEDATIMYGEVAGTYDKSECPEYTDAGTYTVYYQVTKDNYATVQNSETVTIKQAVGTINYETVSISKKYGDAAFTNTLTISGDGTVTYSSSHEDVATVDADGKVTIVGNGTTTIAATVTDGKNYTYTTKSVSYSLSVGTAAMEVSAIGFEGTYDGKAHGITVTVPEGAAIGYGVEKGTYNLTESPTYTEAGTYTIYYLVTKPNYSPVTGSQTVTINKAAGSISYENSYIYMNYDEKPFTIELTNTGDGTVTYLSSNPDVATVDANTGEVKMLVKKGETVITATVTDGKNYTYETKTASYNLSFGIQEINGDLNLDGKTNKDDLNALVSHIMGETPEDFHVELADLNGDEKINAADVVKLIDIISSMGLTMECQQNFDIVDGKSVVSSLSCTLFNKRSEDIQLTKCELYYNQNLVSQKSFSGSAGSLSAGGSIQCSFDNLSKLGAKNGFIINWHYTSQGETFVYHCNITE